MRSLAELLNNPVGRDFLFEQGIFIDSEAFRKNLRPPAQPGLIPGGQPTAQVVYVGQQMYVDYSHSVIAKIQALKDLAQHDILPLLWWLDTDRSGADKQTTKIVWANSQGTTSILVAPPGYKYAEPRFIPVDAGVINKAIKRLESALYPGLPHHRQGVKQGLKRLEDVLYSNKGTLSDLNLQVSKFLIREHLHFKASHIFVSDTLKQGLVTTIADRFLNRREDVIAVFNEAVAWLQSEQIDPQVGPLKENYLPYYYACDQDATRLPLVHKQTAGSQYAVGTCRTCHAQYRFYLGDRTLSAQALYDTNRWSPDVTWPIFANDLVSGVVAGKSSALYALVLNRVMQKVLDLDPIPLLVPFSLAQTHSGSDTIDSLLYAYLHALPETE